MILRFADQQAFRRMRPERCLWLAQLALGGGGFGATAALRDDPGLARIETPVLMLVRRRTGWSMRALPGAWRRGCRTPLWSVSARMRA
jgi:hypothetical protein